MASFILDVTNNGKKLATMVITAGNGTDPDGFGWDWFGGGFNDGGRWEWLPPGDHTSNFNIVLKTSKGELFGFVEAAWSSLSSPSNHPPEPWFDKKGINSGEVTVVIKQPSGQTAPWQLR